MPNINSTLHIGAITREPVMRYTPNGVAILNITVAGEQTALKANGEPFGSRFYVPVTLIGGKAEELMETLVAGSVVAIEGALDYREWDDTDGNKRNDIGIKARSVDLATGFYGNLLTDTAGGFYLEGGINLVTLAGNFTKDVEVRQTTNTGSSVTSPQIAVGESWKDKSGNWQEKTHWVNLTLWGDLAIAAAACGKGDRCFVTGRLENEKYEKDGVMRYKRFITAERFAGVTQARKGQAAPAPVVAQPKAAAPAKGTAPTTSARAKFQQTAGAAPDIDAGLEDDFDF